MTHIHLEVHYDSEIPFCFRAVERATSQPDVDWKVSQEALDYSYSHKGNEQSDLQKQEEEEIKQLHNEENEKRNKTDGEESDNRDFSTESITENNSASESSEELIQGYSFGEIWQDLLSPEPQRNSLGDIQPFATSSRNTNSSCSQYNVKLTQAISHDVSLHEAMFLRSNNTTRIKPEMRSLQRREPFLQLNSSITNHEPLLNGTSLMGLFPSVEIRNLTNQDHQTNLEENIFDEINTMSLALEEGFDHMAISQLFGELDSDSGLSINSNHSTAFSNSDSSAASVCSEGAVGYSTDARSISHNVLGAVGNHFPEPSKYSHMDYQRDLDYLGKSTLQQLLHNHTYNQLPNQLTTTSEHCSLLPGKPDEEKSRCHNSTDANLSRDECHAKALRIPFSIDEIVSMPVDLFNSMLSTYYLTDSQISLIRDIRRRGKNKVAAQNCRKRKLDVILNLEEDVCNLQAQRESLKKERTQCNKSISLMKQKLCDLYRDIFSRLRDDQGRPVNPSQYAVHWSSDGSVFIIPRRLVKSEHKQDEQKNGNKKK
ncbi:PREDICTED: nuclear factor erythroid 2-related factor 3 [Gavialis gangeticus]|uniref:nuclear factor erythroid 2-related factor 3 n=1 Tax=Gavialis gangeticus TaxID=94835 RepID=UPI00092E2F20|nr:PREDICTED: nuclear factor erythroid 2-related factor 3 [Gavialis gangeticus]